MKTKHPNKISVPTLAQWANLTERRIRQLCEEGKIPRANRGALPLPAAIQSLFAVYQGDQATVAKERLLLLKAKRQTAEQKLSMVLPADMLPASVLKDAYDVALGKIQDLGYVLYNCGVALPPGARGQLNRLSNEFCEDFVRYCRQWLARQCELAAQAGQEKPEDPEEQLLVSEHLAVLKALVDEVAEIPSLAAAKLGLTEAQSAGLKEMVRSARLKAAAKVEVLPPR